jgi:aerobic-type carbon monoxide dehydrogenase small subunit (CoxS/CutS family)
MKVDLRINGASHSADIEPRKTLLDALRENFLLNGTHAGCETASAAPAPCWSTASRCDPA